MVPPTLTRVDLTMEAILDLNLGWLIFGLCFIPSLCAVLLYGVTQHGPLAVPLQEFRGVVAPFFASVGIIFAVFAAFLGSDIWERVQHSNHSLEQEVSAVQSIIQIANALGNPGTPIIATVNRYVHATLDEELSRRGQPRSVVADSALEELVREVLDLPKENGKYGVAQSAMLAAYESLWQARATRRHIANTHSDPYKWLAVILLGFLTQVAVTVCQLDKPKPLAAALFIFTLAYAVTLVALVMHERPLSDPTLVSLEHLNRVLSNEYDVW